MMAGTTVVAYFIALSAAAILIFGIQRWAQRLGAPLDRPILGAMALVVALRPLLLALTLNTTLPWFRGFFGQLTSGLAFIAPLLFLSLMIVHSMLGNERAVGVWAALTAILGLAGVLLPVLAVAVAPHSLWEGLGLDPSRVAQLGRLQVAGAAGLAIALYLVIALFQILSMRLTGRWRFLRPLIAILVCMWVYATISVSLGYMGSGAWPEILPGEVINGTISVAMLTPVILLGWAYLERVDAFTFADRRRWLSDLIGPSDEMERLEGHLQILASARSLMLRSGSARSLLSQICELLVASGRYKAVWFGLFRQDGRLARAGGASGEKETALTRLGSRPDEVTSKHPVADMFRHKRTVILQDISIDPLDEGWRKRALELGLRSAALLPVQQEGKVTACLAAYSRKSSNFDEYEVRLLQKLTDDLTYRLHELEIEEKQLKRMKELEAMRDINAYMVAQPDIPLVLQAIVKKAANLLAADGGLMFLTESHRRQIRCVVSYETQRDMTGSVVPFGEGVAGAVAERGRPANISRNSRWQEGGGEDSGSEIVSMLCAPMIWQGEVTGLIGLERGQGRSPFSDEELDMLTVFANQAAMVLQNARLIEDARDKVVQLEQLNSLTRAAIGASNIPELGRILAGRLCQLAEAQGCLITLKDFRSGALEIAATSGALQGIQEASGWAMAITEKVLRTMEPHIASDGDQSEALELGLEGAGRVVALPLVAGQQGLGGAILTFGSDQWIEEGDVQIFNQAAIQAALALSKLQSIEAEQMRSSELETLRQASLSVTSILDLEAVLEAILAHTLRLLDADDAHIFIFEEDEITFGAALWAGAKQREPYSQPRKGGLTETVAHSGKRVIVPDVDEHDLFTDWPWGGGIAGFPLRIGSRVLGVMTVAWEEPHDFLQEELRAMELLADQAAIAIANVRLFERMDAERQRVQLLYDVTNAIASSLDPGEILRRSVNLTTENFHAATGAGFVLEPESGNLKVGALAHEEYFGESNMWECLDLELGKGLEGWVAENKEAVMLADIHSDERWTQFDETDLKGIRSVLSAPILAGVQTLGVISLLAESPFKPEQLELLQAIGQQVGLALSNARRYQLTVRQLRERTVLQQVAQVVTKRLEIQPLIREITRQVGQELGYPIVELYLVEGDQLVLKAMEGFEGEEVRIPLEEGVLGRVARTNQPALVPDVDQDAEYIPGVQGMKSEIAVPLRKADVVVGVLNVETPARYGLTQDDLRLLSLLADQVSIALENAALYERLRQDAEKLELTVAERTAALAEALEQAREANEIKTQFVSDVSHELRTPLTNIRLYLELLETGQPARFESYLDTLQRETDRLVTLIEDLLAISRLDAGTATPNPVSLDLNRLAQSLVDDRRRLFSAKELKLEFKPDAPLSRVVADERMLTQVVANLLTNALNYTRPGGRVLVKTGERLSAEQEWVTLTVGDTGLGIQPRDKERIFDRFYRGSAAREEGKPGTGLGLAICKEILERHGGRITVESEPNKGSQFTIWLPKRPESVRSQSWTGASGLRD